MPRSIFWGYTSGLGAWMHCHEGRMMGSAQEYDRKLMTPEELETEIERQKRIYSTSFPKLWRICCTNQDLSQVNLTHVDLRESDLSGSDFVGNDLTGIGLSGAILRGAQLDNVVLKDANLEGADMRSASLVDADLRGAWLADADLTDVDFTRARLQGAFLHRKDLGQGIIQERRGDFSEAKLIYLTLKNCFQSIGVYGGASWAYGRERRMGKKMSNPCRARRFYQRELPDDASWRTHAWKWWGFYARHTAKWGAHWFVELLCDYGESIWRVGFWLGALWLALALCFWTSRALEAPTGEVTASLSDYLAYSLGGLTTTSFAHLRPRTDIAWVPFATALEALLGIGLTGLLGFVLGNRIGRA
jgi:hypothetical protein